MLPLLPHLPENKMSVGLMFAYEIAGQGTSQKIACCNFLHSLKHLRPHESWFGAKYITTAGVVTLHVNMLLSFDFNNYNTRNDLNLAGKTPLQLFQFNYD